MNIRHYSSILVHNKFYLLFASDAISNMGDWLSVIALMILCYNKTNSPLGVSAILLARAIPTFFLSFMAGAIVDRINKKKIIVITNLLRGMAIFVLTFNNDQIVLYTISMIVAAAGSFFNPAIEASIPGLVGEDKLVTANSLITAEKTVAMIIGPALAAVSIKHVGISATFFLDAASFIIFAFAVLFVPIPSGAKKFTGWHFFTDIKEGLKYVISNKNVLSILISFCMASCAMGALGTLEIVFCSKVLNLDSATYGKIVAIAGMGAIIASVFLGNIKRNHILVLYFGGLLLFGTGIVFFSLQSVFLATIPFLLMEGVGESIFSVSGKSYLQYSSREDILGKVMAHKDFVQKVGMVSGMVLSGILATYFEVRAVLISFGAIIMVASIITAAKSNFPDFRTGSV